MILVVDIGNTNITCGVYQEKKLICTFRLTTQMPRTSDEYGIVLRELLDRNGMDYTRLEGVIIASVVPNIMHSFQSATSENPKEIGPDRIVDAVAAYEIYGGPVLVLDFGTATTYDLVEADGTFAVGITAPGIRISAKALWEDTAKLPEIEIRKPKSILAKETISSMQAGLMYGQIGQTEYIINQVKKETGYGDLKVVATGGLGRIISDETDTIQHYDSALTLEGLRILYEKNCR